MGIRGGWKDQGGSPPRELAADLRDVLRDVHFARIGFWFSVFS
jgi:hypothetical protein